MGGIGNAAREVFSARAILSRLIFKSAGLVLIVSYITIFISFALFPWG